MKKIEPSSLFLSAMAILAYCATPWFGFVFDDRKQVLTNPMLLHLGSIPGYFLHAGGYLTGDLSYYRPLFGAWMNANYQFFGLRPAGWHIGLLCLHLIAVFLCYRVIRAITQEKLAATVAALLFAVHPIHVESVAWVSGGTDPLATVFIVTAFLLYLAGKENWKMGVLGWVAFAASLLCKETALLFPLLVLAHELLLRKDSQRFGSVLKQTAPYVAIALAYLVIRIEVMGSFSHALTPLPFGVVLLTIPSILVFYVRQFFLPVGLSPFYDTPYVKTASLSGFLLPLLVLIGVVTLLFWWVRGLRGASQRPYDKSKQAVFFIVWTVLFLIPALNFTALDPGEIAHDRYLYLSSIGLCALMGIALQQLVEKLSLSESVRKFAIIGLGAILCIATIAQSLYWKSDLSLYRRGASIATENINAQNNLGNTYLERGDFDQGIAIHQAILRRDPGFADSYFNLGLAYYNLGDMAQAQTYLQHAVSIRPTAQAYFYLGVAEFKKGEAASAEQSLAAAMRLETDRPDFHAILGLIYESEGKLPLALGELQQSLVLKENPKLRQEAAKIQGQLNRTP